jgi:hypothetical protein
MEIAKWDFTCTCDLCTIPLAERRVSDQRRLQLLDIHEELTSLKLDEAQLDERIEQIEYILEMEEIWPLRCEYYMVAARAYIQTGLLERARRYLAMSEEAYIAFGGENHDEVEQVAELWKYLGRPETR